MGSQVCHDAEKKIFYEQNIVYLIKFDLLNRVLEIHTVNIFLVCSKKSLNIIKEKYKIATFSYFFLCTYIHNYTYNKYVVIYF